MSSSFYNKWYIFFQSSPENEQDVPKPPADAASRNSDRSSKFRNSSDRNSETNSTSKTTQSTVELAPMRLSDMLKRKKSGNTTPNKVIKLSKLLSSSELFLSMCIMWNKQTPPSGLPRSFFSYLQQSNGLGNPLGVVGLFHIIHIDFYETRSEIWAYYDKT